MVVECDKKGRLGWRDDTPKKGGGCRGPIFFRCLERERSTESSREGQSDDKGDRTDGVEPLHVADYVMVREKVFQ
eukprot:scaffold715_cov164-Amphora_coffeaeformis.AAC.2